jgi:hypothetical protein
MRNALRLAFLGCLVAPGLACAQAAQPLDLHGSSPLGSKQWITFLGPESVSLIAATAAEVPLHFQIENGFHINSHTPKSDYLIPTQLLVVNEVGVSVQKVDFPAGTSYAFSFDPKNKLDVYDGNFTLVAHLRAARGQHTLHALLHYQACDHAACYPPKSLPIEIKLTAQ